MARKIKKEEAATALLMVVGIIVLLLIITASNSYHDEETPRLQTVAQIQSIIDQKPTIATANPQDCVIKNSDSLFVGCNGFF